jgi:hypothetical protein
MNNNNNNKKEKNNFNENVVKFIKYDDLIKETILEHRNAIKELKSKKKENELLLINYLNKNGNDIINYGNSDVIKKIERNKRKSLNIKIIKSSILDDLKSSGIINDDIEGDRIINRIMNSMKNKRPITKIVELIRKKI